MKIEDLVKDFALIWRAPPVALCVNNSTMIIKQRRDLISEGGIFKDVFTQSKTSFFKDNDRPTCEPFKKKLEKDFLDGVRCLQKCYLLRRLIELQDTSRSL